MTEYLCEEDMNTGEYISRDKALKIFHQCCDNCTSSYNGVMCRACADADAMDILIDIPAADVQPVNPLVKVEERVPNVSGNYLCYLSDGEFEVLYFDREIEDDEYNNDYPFGIWNTYPSEDGGECREWIEVLEVTHWQPLPEPPKDGKING
jgi:hypothetical protein